MARSARLRLQDLRAIHRLVGECRELGDSSTAWRSHLLTEASRLAGAALAIEYEAEWRSSDVKDHTVFGAIDWGWDHGFDRSVWDAMHAEFAATGGSYQPMFEPYFEARNRGCGPCLTRVDLVSDRDWFRSPYFRVHHSSMGVGEMSYCIVPMLRNRCESALMLIRAAGEPDFAPRVGAIVQELQAQAAPLIEGPLAGYHEPSPDGLTPRARQVLRCLLEGDGDKQIAARLGLSRHTVNFYVRRIFEHFGVGTRAELMARWIRRGWVMSPSPGDAP